MRRNLNDIFHAISSQEVWGTRHTLAILAFLGLAILTAMQGSLSVAILAMVRPSGTSDTVNDTDSSTSELACPYTDDYVVPSDEEKGEFDWDEKTRGLILGAYFYGYACTNILGGMAAERYGGRLIFGICVLATGVVTLLSPLAARTSAYLFVAVRIVLGFCEGASMPAVNSLLASWVLPEELSKYSSFVYSGAMAGTVVALSLTGVLCDSSFLGGWPSSFYVFGAFAIIWTVLWFPLVRSTPAEHPRISKEELKILERIVQRKCGGSKSVPWRSVATSLPVWAVIVGHTGAAWGFYNLLTELPTYLDQIQHVRLSSNGLLSALPYAFMVLVSVVFGQIAEYFTKKGAIRVVNVRRLSTAISGYVPMLAYLAMFFVGCNRTAAIVVFCTAAGATGTFFAGIMCSHVDLAPRYAATLMGLTNTFATITGILAPYVTGVITNNNETLSAWYTVFGIAAAFYAVSATFYIVNISADIQPWNYYGTDDAEEKREAQP